MNLYEILKENMVRFKTKNLIDEQQFQNDINPEYPLSYWEKQFIWFPGKLKPVKLKSDDGLVFKYRQIAKILVPKAIADNLTGAWDKFVKTLKAEYPNVYKTINGGPGSESMGIMVNKDYKQSSEFTIILIGPRKTTWDVAVITASSKSTWDDLTNKGWRTNSSSDSDSIPLDKNILRTNIYVTGPTGPASESTLFDDLRSLSSANGISLNRKFNRAGGRVINRANLEDINHPGKKSQLQYMVVFIDSEEYTDLRNELYPNIMNNIFKPYGNVPKAGHIDVIEA